MNLASNVAMMGAHVTGSSHQSCQAHRRRHSHAPRRRSSIVSQITESEEALFIKIDLFLSNLERRLEFIENNADFHIDAGIARALATLQAVREKCTQAPGEMIGAGRRRLHLLVETIETRYHEALAAAESLNEKARVAIELLDAMLVDFEHRAHKMRRSGLVDVAGALMGESKRVVDEGIELAREVVDESIGAAVRVAESLEEHIERAVEHARLKGLLLYDDLPVPWRNNPHIIRGYRFTESKIDCVWSMFGISNELVNIWSHAVGFVIMLAVALYCYPMSANFSLSSKTDIFVSAVFFFTACLTLACSTVWHTMNAVADMEAISLFACVDYTGISFLIAASIITTEWTAFYCDPISRMLYISLTAVLGTAGVVMPWHPRFNKPDKAWLRVTFFVGLGATGFLPVLQLSYTHGFEFVYSFYSPIAKSVAVYLLGALVYASKVPECWYPGMFDYIGGSHNLWHMAVLGGIFFHYTAMQEFFQHAFQRAQHECALHPW